MERERVYRFSKERLQDVFMEGFRAETDRFETDGGGFVILPYLDSGKNMADWGRLHIDMELSSETMIVVYAAALSVLPADSNISKELFETEGTKVFINREDMLLYDLKGRYLLIMVEARGEGRLSIGNIKVYEKGDFLLDMFPGIYRKRNSVLHRYLSIFTTIYQNMQERIEELPMFFIPDKAPKDMLPVLARWMGLDLGEGILDEKVLRLLVKEAYSLNRVRGTRQAIQRIIEILTGRKPLIAESNLIPDSGDKDRRFIEKKLYGDNMYDVAVLIPEGEKYYSVSQLMFYVNQLAPAKCRLKIIWLCNSSRLDDYTYSDINGCLPLEDKEGFEALDAGVRLK